MIKNQKKKPPLHALNKYKRINRRVYLGFKIIGEVIFVFKSARAFHCENGYTDDVTQFNYRATNKIKRRYSSVHARVKSGDKFICLGVKSK